MIQFSEAQNLILKLARQFTLKTEAISLEDADGRIASEDILSPEFVPSFDNSAMDGFALCSKDTLKASALNPVELSVVSMIAAGDDIPPATSWKLNNEIIQGDAAEIMTGAPMPEHFDSVIKIEDTLPIVDAHGKTIKIAIRSVVPIGNNVRKKGQDYQIGQIVLKKTTKLRPDGLMALASLGIDTLQVFKKPKVAILSTGKELVPFETKTLQPGKIRNSTGIYLKSALVHLGASVTEHETILDDSQVFKSKVQYLLNEDVDLLVTTGAVSMGKFDFIVSSLHDLGAEILFHKVAIRPGKPILLAQIYRPGRNPLVIFGMPGNPVSSVVGLRFFLAPFLREINGRTEELPLRIKLSQATPKPRGLQCFFKARLETHDNNLAVRPLSGQASFMVSPLVHANAWVLFPEDGTQVDVNQEVSVFPLLPDQSFDMGVL
ncbi:MAG: molybdopterin molybdotransferase MoeA [Bdellovibrionaceae bacterium]|nr:molybdopterin molybdotransferase MoeA [Pseudobdellovibrionaceae bacterium]